MPSKRGSNYEVGYGKPPRHTRFKKGKSGNPRGRPNGSENAAMLLNEALRELVVVNENGRTRKITKLEAAMTQLANKAAAGKDRSLHLLLNHLVTTNHPALGDAPEQIPIELIRELIGEKPVAPASPPQRLVPAVEKDPSPSASGATDDATTTRLDGGPYSIEEIRGIRD